MIDYTMEIDWQEHDLKYDSHLVKVSEHTEKFLKVNYLFQTSSQRDEEAVAQGPRSTPL